MLRASTTPPGAQAQPVGSGSQRGPGLCLAEFDSPRSHEAGPQGLCGAVPHRCRDGPELPSAQPDPENRLARWWLRPRRRRRDTPARGSAMPDEGFTELAGQRVALRRFRLGDVPEFVAYRSSAEVARFQGWDAPYPAGAMPPKLPGCWSTTWSMFAPSTGSLPAAMYGTRRLSQCWNGWACGGKVTSARARGPRVSGPTTCSMPCCAMSGGAGGPSGPVAPIAPARAARCRCRRPARPGLGG